MGAKITTGTNFRYTREILLDYVCSNCGTHNQCTDNMSVTIFSSVLFPSSNPYNEAMRKFDENIRYLNEGPVPDRYKDAELRCRCKNCRKSEPWARLKKVKVKPALFWVPCCLMLVVSVATESIPGGIPKILTWLSGTIPYLFQVIKNKRHTGKILKQIKELPEESLPKASFVSFR